MVKTMSSQLHGSVASAATLDAVRIDARGAIGGQGAQPGTPAAVKVDVFEVEGVDVTGDVAEEGQADVDQQVGAAAGHHEHAHRREDDGDKDNEDGGHDVRHGG